MLNLRRLFRLLVVSVTILTAALVMCYWRNGPGVLRVMDIRCNTRMQNSPKRFMWDSEALNRSLQALDAEKFMRNMDSQRNRFEYDFMPPVESMKSQCLENVRWISVTVLKSAAANRDRRNAIRETWGSLKTFNGSRFFTVFVLGKPKTNVMQQLEAISTEHEAHGDILLIDIPDSAEHVPEKTLAGMQWAAEFLPASWVYSSADDDMSLHLMNFARYIDSTKEKFEKCNNTVGILPIMCLYSYREKDAPIRDSKSKWYTSLNQYPAKKWPSYCRGGWYSMTVGLAGEIYEVSRWMEFLSMDDVWITGLMRIKYLAGITTDTKSIRHLLLDAAPLSRRTNKELLGNLKEPVSEVIVSHAWGNIPHRKVDVPKMLKSNWEKWLSFFLNKKA